MKWNRAPVNTERLAAKRPDMQSWVMGGAPNKILEQEAQGQRSFVGSDTLPTDIGRHSDYDTKAILEAAGVKFLGQVEGDDMFQYVEFPQGWKKVGQPDHSMWSNLVDDKGRVRATIFYKAAFYDRSAQMSLSCRFGCAFDYDRFDKENIGVANITDGGKVVHTPEPIPANGEERYDVSDKANKVAVEWLDQNHPDWRNPGAYWD